jgi:hypothetical protein
MIEQSKPWVEEGKWSHIQANREEPFSGYQIGRLSQDREKVPILKSRKEGRIKREACS